MCDVNLLSDVVLLCLVDSVSETASLDVTDQANDVRQAIPMVDQTVENLDAAGVDENIKAFTADAGYFSEENMDAVD